MKVAKVMNRTVASCTVNDKLSDAAQLMWDRAVGSVVVLGEGGRLAGLVTDRDVAMSAQTQGRPLKEIPVAVAMSAQVETCRPEETVRSVVHRMRTRQVRRCPVVDAAGSVVGLLSLDDLAKQAAQGRVGIDQKDLAAGFAAVAKATGAPQPGSEAPAAGSNGGLSRLAPSAIANEVGERAREVGERAREVGERARNAWGRLRSTWTALGKIAPTAPGPRNWRPDWCATCSAAAG